MVSQWALFVLCRETLLQERETLEENAECRLAIFKDLVGKTEAEEAINQDCAMKVETKVC